MNPLHKPVRALGCALLLCLAIASVAAAGEEVTVDGVLHVKNPATLSSGVETIALQEQWRAGGEDDDEVFFGLITQVRADEAGRTYLLDTQLSEVKVFGPDGEFVTALSREGDGPGEVRTPTDLLFMPDGNLGIVQAFPGKIVKIDREGNPAGDFAPRMGEATAGGFLSIIDAKCCAGRTYLGGSYTTMREGGQGRDTQNFVGLFADDGANEVIFHESSFGMDFTNLKIREVDQYTPSRRAWAVFPDGRVVLAPERNSYVLNVYKPDGSLERVIEREFTTRPRNDLENARVDAIFEAQTRNIPIEIDFTKAESEQDVAWLNVDPDGFLWVAHSRSGTDQPEGVMTTYDVFDGNGHLVRQVAMACEGDPDHDALMMTGKRHAVLVHGFVDALMALQAGGALEMEEGGDPEPMAVVSYSW